MAGDYITVWIPGDQLLEDHPAVALAEREAGRERVRIVMIESAGRIGSLAWHRKKLALVLSAMRHYSDDLRSRGYKVDYLRAPSHLEGLQTHIKKHKPARLFTMAASEFRARSFQNGRLSDAAGIPVTVLPNTQFLVGGFDPIPEPEPGKRYLMETFYRSMRRHFDVLMDSGGKPLGGKWNYDEENRRPLKSGVRIPEPITFKPDGTTQQVIEEVDRAAGGTGSAAGFDLAVTRSEALHAADDFIRNRLTLFGTYEDAMTVRSATVFHSILSPYLNLGLLEPMELVRAAEREYLEKRAPLNSVEGFIRQILGWREFIYWQYWRQMPDLRTANSWNASRPMPGMFWSGETDMNCIRHVAGRVLADGYSHHIERLMVVCNFCLLSGIDPAEVADWFLALYVDAYDWVVLPNVIGMGLNADDGLTATKPYISSANYINKMSDYCADCRYNHKFRIGDDACPFNFLYWNFLIEHEQRLRSNPRLGPAVLGLSRIGEEERLAIRKQAKSFLNGIAPLPKTK